MSKRKWIAVLSVALVAAAIGAAYAMAGGKGQAKSFSLKDFHLPATPERVVTPKGSSKGCNKGVALWALVDADGSVSANCGATEVGIYPPGFYVVSFNRNISNCAYQVTQGINGELEGPPFAAVPMYLRPGIEVDSNTVGVFFMEPGPFTPDGFVPSDFSLNVTCS